MAGRILVLDIETKPITTLVWGLFNQNIALNQIRDPGGIICVGAKWLGEKKTHFFSVWQDGYETMLIRIAEMLDEADAVITYNGNKFDLKKLRGAFAETKLTPHFPNSIDVYKTVQTLGLISNKLAFVGPFFKIGKKIQTGGMELWTGVMDGDEKCQRNMEKYCVQDVVLLEEVYHRLLPYIANHPNIGGGSGSCSRCGCTKLHRRGWRFTKLLRIRRYKCTNCGGWEDGEREKL